MVFPSDGRVKTLYTGLSTHIQISLMTSSPWHKITLHIIPEHIGHLGFELRSSWEDNDSKPTWTSSLGVKLSS